MGVARRIVFPTLRLIIWAVIAVALVKMAFAGPTVGAEDPLEPSAEIVEPVVPVTTASITNTVTVPGSVVEDPPVTVRATLAGAVSTLLAAEGQAVEPGTPVLEIRSETPVEPTVTTDPETGAQTITENRPRVTKEVVTAPVAGTLHLTVLKGQLVSIGDAIGTVAPGTLSVTGTLSPDQRYRLITVPTEAEVTLHGGPAPFVCTGLRLGAAAGAASDDPAAPDGDAAGATASGTVTCAVPPGVTAFAGLGADIAITNGTAEDALVVPVTAVQGSVQTGNVWVVQPDGSADERAVSLGLTDGEVVQVVEGLTLDDSVLEFVPVSELPAGEVPLDGGCDPATGC